MEAQKTRSPLKPEGEWHSRGFLPHWEAGETPQAIFFRLADSMPVHVRERWVEELDNDPNAVPAGERRRRLEAVLDAGFGEAFLCRPTIGPIIEAALLYFDGDRYRLHAWCVMSNHVHVLLTPIGDHALSAIVHGLKSYTAKEINKILGRRGKVWFEEYFDRKIRNEKHFEDAHFYIEQNPVKAKLCVEASAWGYSSASYSRRRS